MQMMMVVIFTTPMTMWKYSEEMRSCRSSTMRRSFMRRRSRRVRMIRRTRNVLPMRARATPRWRSLKITPAQSKAMMMTSSANQVRTYCRAIIPGLSSSRPLR